MTYSSIGFPLLLVNLKTYSESLGVKAVKFASLVEEVSEETGVCIAVSPQILDLRLVCSETTTPILAQHMDPISFGKFTGHVLPEGLVEAGCVGTLINHSERRLSSSTIESTVKKANELGLFSVVCVDTPENAKKVAPFCPNAIAIEPPELIGTGIPVSKAKPEIVSDSVQAVKDVNPKVRVLCGAGITNGEDVVASLLLGAEGVLVASGVVKADKPYDRLIELAEAMVKP